MPHICIDEVLMFMAMIPFIGVFFRKCHLWWHNKFQHTAHAQEYSPFERKELTYVNKEDMEYLKGEPVPLTIKIPEIVIDDTDE